MPKQMSEAQRAYESKRAARAGVSLEKWMARKEKDRQVEEREAAVRKPPAVKKTPGLLSRLLEKARKPL